VIVRLIIFFVHTILKFKYNLEIDHFSIQSHKMSNSTEPVSESFQKKSGEKRKKVVTPKEKIDLSITKYLDNAKVDVDKEALLNDLPKKWRIFGDLAILPANSFNNSEWEKLSNLKN
jgi:hypothetical protein